VHRKQPRSGIEGKAVWLKENRKWDNRRKTKTKRHTGRRKQEFG
jgi:hypothetical protein